jgi:hypothetical protein
MSIWLLRITDVVEMHLGGAAKRKSMLRKKVASYSLGLK